MSIRFMPNAPTDTSTKVGDWIPEFDRVTAKTIGLPAGSGPPDIGDGYAVFYLSASEIAAGNLLLAAHAARWRHLVTSGPHVHGELELDDSHTPIAFHEGPGKDGLPMALHVADQLDGDYEASVLIAPPLRFIALWLRDDSTNLIMPYHPDLTPLTNYVPVSIEEALVVLQPIAEEILQSEGDGQLGG